MKRTNIRPEKRQTLDYKETFPSGFSPDSLNGTKPVVLSIGGQPVIPGYSRRSLGTTILPLPRPITT